MRKSLIITILLLIVCIWGVTSAHVAVNAKKDAVTLDETVLFGDKSEVENLIVNTNIHCNNRLFWDTEYIVGELPQIRTDFHFYQSERHSRSSEREYYGVQLDIHTNFGISSSRGIELEDFRQIENFGGMEKILKDVANRTLAGSTNTENVLLSDYYDFYPLLVTLDIPAYWEEDIDGTLSVQQASIDPDSFISRKIADYFRIPVIENHRLEISITKNDIGDITNLNVRTLDDNGPSIWTNSVITENACYFIFNNRTWKDEIMDTSYIPGGYGVYCLPFTYDPEKDQNFVSADTLSTVYALDEETEIVSITKSEDGNKLLLITREKGAYWLTVLDASSAEELQKIHVTDCIEEDYIWNTFYYDNFLVVCSAGYRFSVIEVNETGEYERVFTGDELVAQDLGMPTSYNSVMCWDGEKLAVATYKSDAFRDISCGFWLSVYDETGPLYIGRYDSSLDLNNNVEYSYRCRPIDSDNLYLSWGS